MLDVNIKMNRSLDLKLKSLPNSPGVYLYKNATGEIIYVGKAKVLKRRVKQYFQNKHQDIKTQALVREIDDLEVIETESELDALFLESELIKRYKPAYNILLRDDKNVTYIKISSEVYPVISYTRQPLDDGAEYFGPFYNVYPVKQAMRYLRWIFPYLTKPLGSKTNSRLEWHIGLNPKLTTEEQRQKYLADLMQIKRYIKGERRQIIVEIEKAMKMAARQQDFELAAKLRNQVQALKSLQQKVRIIDEEQCLEQDRGLRDLQELFQLKKLPSRIEGFDISHMSGTNVVASMVVFINGLSARAEYRKFKTKIDQNNDFYNMNETLKRRFNEKKWPQPDLVLIDGGKGQLGAALASTGGVWPMFGLAEKQELIVIHKTQSQIKINAVKLAELKGIVFDEGNFWVLRLPETSPALRLLIRVRDEAHRFAVGYHTKLKVDAQTLSSLDQIRGIGPQTRQKLLKKYKSLAKIKQASLDEIAELIGAQKASLIWQAIANDK